MLFAFAAVFLALAAAQCSLEGNTYASDSFSVTFGVAVGSWTPAIVNLGGPGTVVFHTVKKATSTRWEWQAVGSPGSDFCDGKGQYNIQILDGCTRLVFTALSDACPDRAEVFEGSNFVLADAGNEADCVSSGRRLDSTFRKSEASPILSTEPVSWIFGMDEFAIATIGDFAAIFQRWAITYDGNDVFTEVRDFASVPDGLACSNTKIGSYNTTWGENCSVRMCGVSDGCEGRGQLLHRATVNDWEAPEDDEGCFQRAILVPGFGGQSRCSVDEHQWLGHPYDCVNQEVDGGCMFCRGKAGGRTVSLCLDRLGSTCDDIFETDARRSFCNLEFECPASTVTATLAVFISAFLALFH